MLPSLLRGLRQPCLDLRIRSGAGTVTRIVETPGLWMAPDALAALRRDLDAVARASLGGALAYGAFADPRALGRSVVTLVSRASDGRPLAFNVLALLDVDLNGAPERVLHLGLVMVDPAARGARLSRLLYGLTCALVFLRGGLRPVWVSSVTQVPAVVGLVAETFSDVHPTPRSRAPRDFRQVLIARAMMRDHRAAFGVGPEAWLDEDAFVVRQSYTGGSEALMKAFEAAAPHRDPAVNAFCREVLDYGRGDDVLQVGRIDLAALARFVRRAVPGRMLPGLLAAAVPLLLGRAVLPVLHWLEPSRPLGVLRARP